MLELHTLSQNVMAMLHMDMLILTMPYFFSTRLLLPRTLQFVHIRRPWWRVMSTLEMRQRPWGLKSRKSPWF
jgi:hypothetical protein